MKKTSTRHIPHTALAAGFATLLVLAGPANAATSCDTTVTLGSGSLTQDYEISGAGTCIQINTTDATVDLNGHTITTTGVNVGTQAIKCNAAGITITDSAGTKGGISGLWFEGIVDCQFIDEIEMRGGGASYGIRNNSRPLRALTDSYIEADNTAFQGEILDRTSTIDNNFLRADAVALDITGMDTTSGSGKAHIQKNIIRESSAIAIRIDTNLVNVHDNIIYRRDPSGYMDPDCVDLAGGTTFSDLTCDCPSSSISTNYCEGDEPPVSVAQY